jgi:hypothetical protein
LVKVNITIFKDNSESLYLKSVQYLLIYRCHFS